MNRYRGGRAAYLRKLEVYQLAIEHLTLAAKTVAQVPPGYAEVREQLRRASLSVPLNIAEGVGKTKDADQKRFFAMARGSAMACAALADACRALGIGDQPTLGASDRALLSVVPMLSKMCR